MPQRQRTAPIDARELPALTEQQQEFVRQRLAGKTATDAYKASYSTADMLPRTVWAEASRLNTHPDITAWLSAARQAHLGTAVLTREGHMNELERLREIAIASGNVGAAVQAEQLRGKVAGHQVDRVADVTADLDPFDALRAIARDMGEDVAKQAAAKSGLPWPIPSRAEQADATRH